MAGQASPEGNKLPLKLIVASLIFSLLTAAAAAHEYYLMPERFDPPVDSELNVRHRLGQRFKGNELPWITRWNVRSELWQDGRMREIKSIDGDRPALKHTFATPGLAIFLHQSNIDRLTFKTWDKFTKYIEKEGIDGVLPLHDKAGKPRQGIKELYARYAKTLVDVGGRKEGRDQATGLTIELIALKHPGLLKADEPMPVKLLFRGKPLAGATVKVFAGIGTEFAARIKTDANGEAAIPALGPGPYLLNAIRMTEVVATGKIAEGAHWQSFWASLTYERQN